MICLFKAHVYRRRLQPCPPSPLSFKERQHDINHPDPHHPAPKEYLFDILTFNTAVLLFSGAYSLQEPPCDVIYPDPPTTEYLFGCFIVICL